MSLKVEDQRQKCEILHKQGRNWI